MMTGIEHHRNEHRALANATANVAERVLRYFEEVRTDDDRPRKAIEAARAWARGEVRVGAARKAALGAHAAARENTGAAQAAARAAGHAAAIAHMPRHTAPAAAYAEKAEKAQTAASCAAGASQAMSSTQAPTRE